MYYKMPASPSVPPNRSLEHGSTYSIHLDILSYWCSVQYSFSIRFKGKRCPIYSSSEKDRHALPAGGFQMLSIAQTSVFRAQLFQGWNKVGADDDQVACVKPFIPKKASQERTEGNFPFFDVCFYLQGYSYCLMFHTLLLFSPFRYVFFLLPFPLEYI